MSVPGLLYTKMHSAYQTKRKSSDGAMINRWRQDFHYQAMIRVWVYCGRVTSCWGQLVTDIIQSISELQMPEFLEAKPCFEKQGKATVFNWFTVLWLWLKRTIVGHLWPPQCGNRAWPSTWQTPVWLLRPWHSVALTVENETKDQQSQSMQSMSPCNTKLLIFCKWRGCPADFV